MARLDTGWHAHPRILQLGLQAMGLHAWSISYCDHARSDGFIPLGAWPALPGVGAAVKALIDADLWARVEGGFMLHDYLQYNRSKAKIEAEQMAAQDRQSRHRSRVTEGVTNGEVTASVTPSVTQEKTRDTRARGQPGPGPGDAEAYGFLASPPTPSPSPNPARGPFEPAARAAPYQHPDLLTAPPPEPPERLPTGALQCPLCPDIFTGTYAEHLESPRHKIHDQPADLSNFHA